MKNVLTRSLSGVFLIIIVVGSVWFNSISNFLLFLFILTFGLFEFYRFAKAANFYPNTKIGIATGILIYTLSYLVASQIANSNILVLIIPLIIFISIIELYRQKKNPINKISFSTHS